MKKKTKPKKKANVNLYVRPEALEHIQAEAEEFGLSVSKYVAVVLSHRGDIVERIRSGKIVIVP